MKKKYFIAILAIWAALTLDAKAQIVTSASDNVVITKIKVPRKTKWNFKAGYSMDKMVGLSEALSTETFAGYDLSFGFTRPFRKNEHLFWGMDLGMMSQQGKSVTLWDERFGAMDPVECVFNPKGYVAYLDYRFGGKISLGQHFAIAPYLGIYAGFIFDRTKDDYEGDEISCAFTMANGHTGWERFTVHDDVPEGGASVGLELQLWKHLLFDVHAKRSFTPNYELHGGYFETEGYANTMKVVMSLGVQF